MVESAGAVILRCSLNVFEKFSKGKYLYWSLLLMKFHALRPAALLKNDSSNSVFL